MAAALEGGRRSRGGELPLVRSVERAGRVLEALLVASPEGLRLADIAEQTALHKTTALRLLRTLIEIGVVRRHKDGERYSWDAIHWLAVATKLRAMMAKSDSVQALLDDLAVSSGETINLAYPDIARREALLVAISLSRNPLRVDPGDRRSFPLHATASGKICLAHLPGEVLRAWAEGGLTRVTEHTITSAQRLWEDLALARQRGYAISREESYLGACGVAVPVRSDAGDIVAGLAASAPVQRATDGNIARWVGLLSEAAPRLTEILYLNEQAATPVRSASPAGPRSSPERGARGRGKVI
jgi:DNA-binding IclR family transcriptional regulator